MSGEPDFDAPLSRSFYERPVRVVARELLGCYLVHRVRSRFIGGRIVETEAYGGPGDPGSHADRAPSGRAKIMFGPAGIAYVYFTYGMHHCMNAVTDREGKGSAVLIRALEPMWGIRSMRKGAPDSLPDHRLASGPGRLCRALGVDKKHYGSDLTTSSLRIIPCTERTKIHSGVRVGLTLDDEREWRYWLDSNAVSRR